MSILNTLVTHMQAHGAKRFLIKKLANNDNSKQQIYLGSDFEVIRIIPSGDMYADGVSKKGAIFKAPVVFFWIDLEGEVDRAPNTQIIFYPKYPETRLSGFIQGSNKNKNIAPRQLMLPPTPEQRNERGDTNRYLILGVNETTVWAHCTAWTGELHSEITLLLEKEAIIPVTSVFFEFSKTDETSEEKLLYKLKEIYLRGPINSCRMNPQGEIIPYTAQNGAGYTLEAQFGITPNGFSDPDFMDWELKSHSHGVVTLMTPEPNIGLYLANLKDFMDAYATKKRPERLDFASRHLIDRRNEKSTLTMYVEGFEPIKKEILDPQGGLMLRDDQGKLAAGWSFEKLIDHWKKKHNNTCFVSTTKISTTPPQYSYGPEVTLAKGTDLKMFISALFLSTIYYDPGVNMKLINDKWRSKKRNQFRVNWRNIETVYSEVKQVDLSSL